MTRPLSIAMWVAIGLGTSLVAMSPNLQADPAAPSTSATLPITSSEEPAATGVRTAAEPPSSTRKPPSGLWGATLQDGNDKGIKKATSGAYNYRHIAISAGFIALIIMGLIVLVRRHTGEPRMPGR